MLTARSEKGHLNTSSLDQVKKGRGIKREWDDYSPRSATYQNRHSPKNSRILTPFLGQFGQVLGSVLIFNINISCVHMMGL